MRNSNLETLSPFENESSQTHTRNTTRTLHKLPNPSTGGRDDAGGMTYTFN